MKSKLTHIQAQEITRAVLESFQHQYQPDLNTNTENQRSLETTPQHNLPNFPTQHVHLNQQYIHETTMKLRQEIYAHVLSDEIWKQAKADYLQLTPPNMAKEAENFFNKVAIQTLNPQHTNQPTCAHTQTSCNKHSESTATSNTEITTKQSL